ncbi:MAG: hypothetical protein U5L73_07335 [Rhodoferax sp.]|uniref:hypothetical protein n=1 Tax=Rhodoferax sp. TaxID=50421 RepID=UPI002ACE88D9|nr:hypothetical protein [Rhodoferax sp.]MDZ7891557.1 hypothetical protein [Rhodoferax sp.]
MQSLLFRCGMVVRRRWFAREIRPAPREIIEITRLAQVSGLLWGAVAACAERLAAAPSLSTSPRVTEFA